ncbi:hypothetical protein P9918_22705, partial [Enterobacter hormaechei]|nr:hypothetical protein [Enterobacter hormaechei]
LKAEPVSVNDDMAYAFHHAISDSSLGSDEVEEIKAGLRAAFANVTAQPAPASVPEPIKRNDADGWWMYKGRRVGGGCAEWYNRALDDCRAAMLQGADQVTVKQPSSNSVLGWLRADYQDDNRGLRGNAPLFVLGKKDPSTVWGLDYIPLTSNSPVIQDGWKLVPIEPTEHMIVEGFESEPDEFFSDADVWEAYEAMSGCQQAAHRAKLCWAAMIAAAPNPGDSNG